MNLRGRVAVVTGAGWNGGIGKEIAFTLASKGALVFINDIDSKSALQSVEELRRKGFETKPAVGDITEAGRMKHIAEEIVRTDGKLDILVNNAAIRSSGLLEDIDNGQIDKVIDVNLKGAIFSARAVIPVMKRRMYGRIISIGSIAGKIGGGEYATSTSIYSATKAALGGFTRSLARELGPYGITVNVVSPGLVDLGERSRQRLPEMIAEIKRRIPLGRLGKATDIANAVAFLASEEASYVTGLDFDVNGGWYMGT